MTDTPRNQETPQFETDEVDANRAREQGLGVGERELQAQRDPGVEDFDEDTDTDEGVERNTAVQGQDESETRDPQI